MSQKNSRRLSGQASMHTGSHLVVGSACEFWKKVVETFFSFRSIPPNYSRAHMQANLCFGSGLYRGLCLGLPGVKSESSLQLLVWTF